MKIPYVHSGDPIQASEWNQIADQLNGSVQRSIGAGRAVTVRPGMTRKLTVYNPSNTLIPYLGLAKIGGFAACVCAGSTGFSRSLNQAKTRALNQPVVAVAPLSQGVIDPPIKWHAPRLCVADEPIPPHKTGYATYIGGPVFLAEMEWSDDTPGGLQYAVPDASGRFQYSEDEGYPVVCGDRWIALLDAQYFSPQLVIPRFATGEFLTDVEPYPPTEGSYNAQRIIRIETLIYGDQATIPYPDGYEIRTITGWLTDYYSKPIKHLVSCTLTTNPRAGMPGELPYINVLAYEYVQLYIQWENYNIIPSLNKTRGRAVTGWE